jgi:hypothetical protein
MGIPPHARFQETRRAYQAVNSNRAFDGTVVDGKAIDRGIAAAWRA